MVNCPHCGGLLPGDLYRKKGEGKQTGALQMALSIKQIRILKILEELGAVSYETGQPIIRIYPVALKLWESLHEKFPEKHLIGFYLSSLLGAGFVCMGNRRCEIRNFATQEIQFKRKPVWWLSPAYQHHEFCFDEDGTIHRLKEGGG